MFFLAVRRFRLRSDWVQTEGVLDMERDQPGTFFLVIEGNEVKKGDHFVICSDQKEVTFDGDMEVMISTL